MRTKSRISALYLPLCAALLLPGTAAASAPHVGLGLTMNEEYNDNIFLTPADRVEDYITRIIPSAQIVYQAPLWRWNIDYAYDYRIYAKKTVENDSTHRLKLSNHTTFIEEFFVLDVEDIYRRISLTPVRDYTQESITTNQTDTNKLTATPHFLFRPSSDMNVRTGYQYRSVWYKDPVAINAEEQSGFGELTWDTSPRMTMTSAAWYTLVDTFPTDYRRTEFSVGAKYEYSEDSTLSVTLGKTWLAPDDMPRHGQVTWNVKLVRKFLSYTLTFNTALFYVDDPIHVAMREDLYVLSFRKETERLQLEASGGVWEYRAFDTNYLEDIRYGVDGSVSYALTPALKMEYFLTIERFEDKDLESRTGQKESTSRYLNRIRLAYQLTGTMTAAAEYRYTNNYIPHVYGENYINNRGIVELTWQF